MQVIFPDVAALVCHIVLSGHRKRCMLRGDFLRKSMTQFSQLYLPKNKVKREIHDKVCSTSSYLVIWWSLHLEVCLFSVKFKIYIYAQKDLTFIFALLINTYYTVFP